MQATCLQCTRTPSGLSYRIVRDSCGHEKCRQCLLEDEDHCKQCVQNTHFLDNSNKAIKTDQNKLVNCDKISVNGNSHIELEQVVLNNHTAVIQVNGNIPNKIAINGDNTLTTIKSNVSADTVDIVNNNENSFGTENRDIVAIKPKTVEKNKRRPYNLIEIPKHITEIADSSSYHCTICNKKFSTKTHIKYHQYCEAGVSKPYKCKICNKEFILLSQLDVHSYKHESKKPYSCTTCKKAFSTRSKLVRHNSIHSIVKSHICSECGNAYRSKESLKIHSIIHRGEKPYDCSLCSAKFSNHSNLNKHMAVHSEEKAHMCDQCGKRFKLKWALTVHRRSHLRIKPHECKVCMKAFVNNKDLQRHAQIHQETKSFMCSICSMSFRRQDNLRRHMKNTHPGKQGAVLRRAAPAAPAASPPPPPKDHPNAVNVITTNAVNVITTHATARLGGGGGERRPEAGAAGGRRLPSVVRSDCRTTVAAAAAASAVRVINGPIKLAFKTPAFKSAHNINGGFDNVSSSHSQIAYDMAESVDICQKILDPSGLATQQRHVVRPAEPTTQEIYQRILDPNSTRPLHYETSFQNKKHAMIKNIKFKVPALYTNNFKESEKGESKMYTELGPAAVTSVIVNNNSGKSDGGEFGQHSSIHWRRRTSQNLVLKD
ncbi:unnamed protein product [Phaedon cochleariae]|uniref:C2H2-type domain-containing protein n=1 Tax=Phaedon cochleariae TaxID=80249 RepID=A0A9P0DRB0_PHACE|nr:unnamed protein product [Phaedon cochleariae]